MFRQLPSKLKGACSKVRSPETPLLCALFYLKGPTPYCYLLSVYVTYRTFRPYLVRRCLVLCWPCCVMVAGTALSVRLLMYAGLSLFTLCRPYLYMVVCVYTYNLAWGGLKNGKNGGEPNGFCLVFVVMEKKGR